MKVKKARKRLLRVEGLLTGVLDSYVEAELAVHELLDKAKTAVAEAIASIEKQAAKKPPASATEASKRRVTTEGRRRLSRPSKRPLRKTA